MHAAENVCEREQCVSFSNYVIFFHTGVYYLAFGMSLYIKTVNSLSLVLEY